MSVILLEKALASSECDKVCKRTQIRSDYSEVVSVDSKFKRVSTTRRDRLVELLSVMQLGVLLVTSSWRNLVTSAGAAEK